ncbi:phosphate acyltransferase PlsX [Zhongshania sp.]|uniref:phosphate acyltransferase PlsX n=1 Tax=Zhongshania sp. TaxID=1971902 RepID=UPI003562122F
MASLRLAVDAMSGDHGLRSSIPATVYALNHNSALHILLVGDEPSILLALASEKYDPQRLAIHHAPDIVAMDDQPSRTLRSKKKSSMYQALELLRDGAVSAVVSAGNTGALVAMSCVVLERLPGIKRPAICAPVPAQNGHTYVLDLGANVECNAEQLHQFAQMGSALCRVLGGSEMPRIGLLNVGSELTKGTTEVRDAAELLASDTGLNYIGFVEGGDIFSADVDVVVCDGFAGNVALKVCEGTASFIANELRARFKKTFYGMLVGLLARPLINAFQRDINPDRYNGAALLGLNGVVVKSHGSSGTAGFQSAIRQAARAVDHDLQAQIEKQLEITSYKPH